MLNKGVKLPRGLSSMTRRFFHPGVAILLGLAVAGPFATSRAIAQIVERTIPEDPVVVDSGAISGKLLDSGVRAYFGVPFAAPPVRDLRWREPQPIAPWKGVYHADRKAPECIQVLRRHDINHYFGEEATSEDCLYLNIWASGTAKPGAKLPVIVYIDGGGFTLGSSGMAMYGGEDLAKKGIVFVNFNYRVGALGFLAHPELTAESPHRASGDYGFLDQIAALQWIKRNVAKFGGDPDNVTISGQSAGSASVSALEASPLAKDLFQHGFAMSLSFFDDRLALPKLADAEKTGLEVQKTLGAASIADMRAIPADKILALQKDCQRWTAISCRTLSPPSSLRAVRTTSRRSSVSRATKARTILEAPPISASTLLPLISFMATGLTSSSTSIRPMTMRKPKSWGIPRRAKRWSRPVPGSGRSPSARLARLRSTCTCFRAFIPSWRMRSCSTIRRPSAPITLPMSPIGLRHRMR
jgi:carboxylesterase family protein